jgi:hypothetical protein
VQVFLEKAQKLPNLSESNFFDDYYKIGQARHLETNHGLQAFLSKTIFCQDFFTSLQRSRLVHERFIH